MNLSKSLDRLASPADYAGPNKPTIRWGQLIRANQTLANLEAQLIAADDLVRFSSLGVIRGGVVTRANAFFLVREITFDQIPARLKVTRGDLKRIAAISDGLDHIMKIERQFLKPIIKGPESLESAFGIKRSDLRLFDVRDSKKELEAIHANGALAYIRRGENTVFKTSEDDLKGGIPAQRSQVKNRKPYWYCLQNAQKKTVRIIFPEHIDRRYVFSILTDKDASVVIDKLYIFEPDVQDDASFIHASLNSLYTWYQIELRGRSQLGEGVLELKIPDFSGILLANPASVDKKARKKVVTAFAELINPGSKPSLDELGDAKRHAFDVAYLEACGFKDAESVVLTMERELRALAGERSERRLSVADAKVSRRKITNVAASIDAYAARLAATLSPHPDPRSYIIEGGATEPVSILGEVEGDLEIGVELFNQGEVTAGGVCVARAGSIMAAQFVKGVLLSQPELTQVYVPAHADLPKVIAEWNQESTRWYKAFKKAFQKTVVGVEDPRAKASIEQRALRLLHAI